MVCIWEVDSGKILYKVLIISNSLYLNSDCVCAIASRTQGNSNLGGFPPQRAYQYVFKYGLIAYESNASIPVLTGSKDGTMLLGEIQPGLAI